MSNINKMTLEELQLEIARLKGWKFEIGAGAYAGWWAPNGRPTSQIPEWPIDIAEGWKLIEEIRRNSNHLKIEFDADYGIDHRFGWTVTIDGAVAVELCESASIAICKAYISWRLKDQELPVTDGG